MNAAQRSKLVADSPRPDMLSKTGWCEGYVCPECNLRGDWHVLSYTCHRCGADNKRVVVKWFPEPKIWWKFWSNRGFWLTIEEFEKLR